MTITYEQLMARLQAEGYENVHGDGCQIIVNNRGEIEEWQDGWRVDTRIGKERTHHAGTNDIDELFKQIEAEWPKFEPTNAVGPVLGYIGNRPIFKGDRLYVDIRGTCATEWGEGQIAENSANEGQGNVIIFQDGDYRMARALVFAPIK